MIIIVIFIPTHWLSLSRGYERRQVISASCASLLMTAPVSVSQTMMWASLLPVTTIVQSGVSSTHVTHPVCPAIQQTSLLRVAQIGYLYDKRI